jgi:hypothetical protein
MDAYAFCWLILHSRILPVVNKKKLFKQLRSENSSRFQGGGIVEL